MDKVKLRSGAEIPCIDSSEADKRNYLTRNTLSMLHLKPDGEPVAYSKSPDDHHLIFYFDPLFVVEADPDSWYGDSNTETITLPGGSVIERMGGRRAASLGYYSKENLARMFYDPIEEPVAYTKRANGEIVYFYDKATALRLPMMCVKCGQDVRFRHKLCRACYEEDLAVRRAEGEIHRNKFYGMDPARVLFFDLELTGFYDRDEILSITIVDGEGKLIMDTLVKPSHTKKWKRTEKIHGITPDMVEDAPLLEELTPQIKKIFAQADNIIAYGVSTDYSHIKYIYDTEEERQSLHDKVRCCANEYVRYIHENRPDLSHASLIDAMECFGIEWTGVPHSSTADTFACKDVWNRLFPNYYLSEQDSEKDIER